MKCLNCGKEISNKKKFCNNYCQKEFQYKDYITNNKDMFNLFKDCMINFVEKSSLGIIKSENLESLKSFQDIADSIQTIEEKKAAFNKLINSILIGNKLYFIRKEITAWLMRAVVPKDSPKRRRKEDADKESPQEKPSEEPPCSIEHRIHSRTGADLFAVLFSAELEAAGERKFSQQAREHGGYWSDYGNGGYIFNAQADAERFAQAIIGKKEEPTDTQKEGLPNL